MSVIFLFFYFELFLNKMQITKIMNMVISNKKKKKKIE